MSGSTYPEAVTVRLPEGDKARIVAAAAREIAGVEDFTAGYAAVIDEVRADIAAAAELPVEATPTFVINGVLLKGGLTLPFFDRALALELAR